MTRHVRSCGIDHVGESRTKRKDIRSYEVNEIRVRGKIVGGKPVNRVGGTHAVQQRVTIILIERVIEETTVDCTTGREDIRVTSGGPGESIR